MHLTYDAYLMKSYILSLVNIIQNVKKYFDFQIKWQP